MTPTEHAATEVCSALQLLDDRGELEFDAIITRVRYTDRVVDTFDVAVEGRIIRFTVTDVGEWVNEDDEDDDYDEQDGIKVAVTPATFLRRPR